ncbi:vesicle transport through interaction with t-SNAREs homolog 1A [Eupeodes corollae]|uniref:vesicle transport through interaction with t-SNAREs homolog 1A n=1 Tax=Eupeodes corollae TaxID=290404 RepID=UPI00248FDC03|nr:vesicle transport through interaction with t-SNAREs homolog 1A [Eupeodes corollae]
MTLIDHYEQQYASLIAEITASIGRLNIFSGSERRELCAKIDGSLTEASELLEQIGLEIRDLNPSVRPGFNSKLNCYQVELKRLQNEYKNIKEQSRNHSSLEITDEFDDVSIRDDQKQRLLENSERIERTGNRLVEGYRIAVETEELSTQVLQDLHHQRETLNNARSRLRETNAELGRSSRILNSMLMRALREKAILYGVGGFFVVAVVISVYFSFSS